MDQSRLKNLIIAPLKRLTGMKSISSQFDLFTVICISFFALSACQTSQEENSSASVQSSSSPSVQYPLDQPLVEEKYKISKEPEVLTPTELDEKNYIQSLFQEAKKEPGKIRREFDQAVRKKRDLFQKDHRRKRADFSKNERSQRQHFLKNLESERNEFKKRKVSREERNEFFNQQDEKRKNQFAGERDTRAEFESEMRDRQKNFDDYIKEKTSEFNQEYQSYIKSK